MLSSHSQLFLAHPFNVAFGSWAALWRRAASVRSAFSTGHRRTGLSGISQDFRTILALSRSDTALAVGKTIKAKPMTISAMPAYRVELKRSPKTSADARTPAQGASSAKGATTAAGYRARRSPQIA